MTIDSAPCESGASACWREGFQRLVTDVGMGRAGIVMGLEVSRLARNNADRHDLLKICAFADPLILDQGSDERGGASRKKPDCGWDPEQGPWRVSLSTPDWLRERRLGNMVLGFDSATGSISASAGFMASSNLCSCRSNLNTMLGFSPCDCASVATEVSG